MKKTILSMGLALIGLSGASQTLIQPFQIRATTNDIPIMTAQGVTNLQQVYVWLDANWHTKAGYANTNQVNAWTNTLNTLSNNVIGFVTNSVNSNMDLVTSALSIVSSNAFGATNTAIQTFSSGASASQIAFGGEIIDRAGEFSASTFIPNASGIWIIGATLDLSQADPVTSTGRSILKLYKDSGVFIDLHRHTQYQGGTQNIISGDAIVNVVSGSSYNIWFVQDGGVSATNNIGKGRFWGFKL